MESKIQRVFQDHFGQYAEGRRLPERIHRAASAIKGCRTGGAGWHVQACPAGHIQREEPNSCKHRSCPRCGYLEAERWLARQEARLPRCNYFHIIFTIPDELNAWWQLNRHTFTALLFRAAWHALRELLADPKYLGALPGVIASFHSWGQTLWVHPHVHMLVTGGGMTGTQWKPASSSFLLPSRVLSAKFRGKFRAFLLDAIHSGKITLPNSLSTQQGVNLLNKCGRKKWHVQIMEQYEHGRGVAVYLARYVKGGPVSDKRLSYNGYSIHLSYKDNKLSGSPRNTVKLSTKEFLHRYGQHIPASGIHVVRAYGLFHHHHRPLLDLMRQHLGQAPVGELPQLSAQQLCSRTGLPRYGYCPRCGRPLVITHVFYPIRDGPYDEHRQ